MTDSLIDIWIKYFKNTNKNSNVPSSLNSNLHNIIDELKNSQRLYNEKEMFSSKNMKNKKEYLADLFNLNKDISNKEYNLFHHFQNNHKLFKENFDKIQPFFMRGIIHYFNLLDKTITAIRENRNLSSELSILEDKYTNTFFQLYLYFKDISKQQQPFDEILNFKYPICLIKDPDNDFSSEDEIELKLRKFDSSIFLQIVQFTPDIISFQLAENYFLLLMKNIDNLKYFEFMNINEFCNSMVCHYIKFFLPPLPPSCQSEIIYEFIELIKRLKIGKKETRIVTIPQPKNDENDQNDKGLCLFDYKCRFIETIFKTIIQVIQNIPACKNHLVNCNFFESLLHYTIWLFSNSNFIHVFVKKNIELKETSQFVKPISTPEELENIKTTNNTNTTDNNNNIGEKKSQYVGIPNEVKNIYHTIRLLVQISDNDKLIESFLNDIIIFVDSISKNDVDDTFKEKFNICAPDDDDNELFDKNSFIVTSIFLFCEIIRSGSREQISQIFTSFDSLNFLFNDVLFERVNQNENENGFIDLNSRYLVFVRKSLYMALLDISKIFVPQINDTFSRLIIGTKLPICDEIVTFLLQLITDNEKLFTGFNADLYTVPLISYASQLHGITAEVKRFYFLMSKLLKYKPICNKFYENKLFCNFVFSRLFDKEYSNLTIPLLTSLNQVDSEKAVKHTTKYLLINSIQYLIDSLNKKEQGKEDVNIDQINLCFYQIIELFHYHYYFHKQSTRIALEKTKLLDYIDQCLTVIISNEQFFSIMHLIYSLQYYSDTEQIVKESVNNSEKLILIYQKEYPIYSKLEMNSNIQKILGILVFGYHFKHIFELSEKKHKKVIPIKTIEPLWMIHNVLKYDLKLHNTYFEYIDFVINNLFYNQIVLSNSKFFNNCLNFICNDKSVKTENELFLIKIFKKIVSHVLTWDFPSKLFLPNFSSNKNNFLNIIKGSINRETFNYPSNFAYLSLFHDDVSEKDRGVKFGPYKKSSFSFTLSFSFRYESIVFNEFEDNFEYIIFNDSENKFSIRISKEKKFRFYSKNKKIESGELNNEFIVNDKEWHRIVISIPSHSKVNVAIDGKMVFQLNSRSLYGLLNSNFSFCVCQKFDGLISDIQFLNQQNYTDAEIIKFSTFGIADENKMQTSIISFRPYVNNDGSCLFYDSKYQQYQYYYKGDIILEKYSFCKQLKENDLILCIFSNLNDSDILKKSLKVLLRFLSIENNSKFYNIENLIFSDDYSFLRFVFLLNNQINLFNDDVFGLCWKLFERITSINKKRIFVSEFLFNLKIWKTNFISIYNQLIMNILPNVIKQANSDSNTISSVSLLSILNAIENEESELKKSLLFEILFSFLHKYLLISNQNQQIEINHSIDTNSYILNKIVNFLNSSYSIESNQLNLTIFNDDNNNNDESMNHVLIEILNYIKKGNETIVICFILRLFGLIPTQSETITILEMMNESCKNLIFKRFLEITLTSSKVEIELNSFYKLISYVTQNISNDHSIDILFAVIISTSRKIKQMDFNTEFEIFESISDNLIENQNNESLKVFFLFWSLIILTNSMKNNETGQDDVVNKIIQNFIKFKSKEYLTSFVWLFYLYCINSNQFKKWKLFNDKLINSIILSLKSNAKHPKRMNCLIQIFIDLIITISLISYDSAQLSNDSNNSSGDDDVNILNLMDLIRSDKSFAVFNSFGFDKIKVGFNSYQKEIADFCSVFDDTNVIVYDCNLIYFVTLLICFNSDDESEADKFIHLLIGILGKMDLNEDLQFEYMIKLFKQLSVPKKLINAMKKSFRYFSFDGKEKSKKKLVSKGNTNEGEKGNDDVEPFSDSENEENKKLDDDDDDDEHNKDEKDDSNKDDDKVSKDTKSDKENAKSDKEDTKSNMHDDTLSKDDKSGKEDTKNENKTANSNEENNASDSADGKKIDENNATNNNNDDDDDDGDKESTTSNDSDDDLIKNLILRILSNLMSNVLVISRFYVDFDISKASFDIEKTLRNLCSIEKFKFYLKSYQLHAMNQNEENQKKDEESSDKFIIFNSNYVPLLLTSKNPIIDIVEIENDFIDNDSKSGSNSSISMENVFLHFQGTKKKCHLFYDVTQPNSFTIGGIEILNQNVNFIVKHSISTIEFFLNNGFNFIVEFSSKEEEEKEANGNKPIIYGLIDSFVELTSTVIAQKISELSLNLIEIILLLNFLNGKSFNLPKCLPIIMDVPAAQFILENKQQENESYDDESIQNWCQEFFKINDLDGTIKLHSISKNYNDKINVTNLCIGILTSPVIFLSICNKKVFMVDSENTLKAASLILPPRVNRATIQIFNSNVLFAPISDEIGANIKHNKLNTSKNSPNAHCVAFDVIKNSFLSSSENIKHTNEFFIAASFDEFSGIFVYMVKMSGLSFLKSFDLKDSVSYIIGSENCFVFITKNSNKVHLIKLNSNELNSISHSYFISHNSDIEAISTSQNFIVSIDMERKVCLTLIDSLQTVTTFSIESIPKALYISNSPSLRILAMFNNHNKENEEEDSGVKIKSIDFNGKIIWEFEKKCEVTNMILLKDKTDIHSNVFIALVINNKTIECRRLNEKQLMKSKKVFNQILNVEDDDFEVLFNSTSADDISLIKYDDELDFIGYFDSKNNLNGLFFNYSEKK